MVLALPAAALASAIDASVLLPIPAPSARTSGARQEPAPQHAVELSDPGQQPRRARPRPPAAAPAAAGPDARGPPPPARAGFAARASSVFQAPAAGALAGPGQRRLAALGRRIPVMSEPWPDSRRRRRRLPAEGDESRPSPRARASARKSVVERDVGVERHGIGIDQVLDREPDVKGDHACRNLVGRDPGGLRPSLNWISPWAASSERLPLQNVAASLRNPSSSRPSSDTEPEPEEPPAFLVALCVAEHPGAADQPLRGAVYPRPDRASGGTSAIDPLVQEPTNSWSLLSKRWSKKAPREARLGRDLLDAGLRGRGGGRPARPPRAAALPRPAASAKAASWFRRDLRQRLWTRSAVDRQHPRRRRTRPRTRRCPAAC